MRQTTYVPVIGIIQRLNQEQNCCTQQMTLRTEEGIVNFVISQDTRVIDSRRLRPGMRVAAFYDASLPVPLIYPPQYQAQIVTRLDRDEEITLDYFDSDLTASDGSLQLTPGRGTETETLNGQRFSCSIQNQTLLVYYSRTTRSIPPQTTPSRIIVVKCGR
ncbi:MAG TPA: hypothetical protein IAB31_00400 [Candidatus Choladousia intestinavium]|uniref:Uncharacterized protein n=1 Tax=Candidatus Choladousia intestinavium TaxID=2840727 RepID=A0A9D1ABI8_9FIRM|nr:hypothetical protein [Candidatus Choladousia intestinavium]